MTCDICQGRRQRLPWEYGRYGLTHADQPVVDAVPGVDVHPVFYKPTRMTDADGRDCWRGAGNGQRGARHGEHVLGDAQHHDRFYDRAHIDEAAAAARTIVIDTGTVRATDFGLDRKAQDLLFREGREAPWSSSTARPGSRAGTGKPASARTGAASHQS
jgi:hypothetical protein